MQILRIRIAIAAAAIALAASALLAQTKTSEKKSSAAKAGSAAIYPDPAHTPGATNPDITDANKNQTVCNKDWSGTNKYTHKPEKGTAILRPPTSITDPIKVQTMKDYGHTDADNHYELDHFISLELGGCPDCVTNLWPQPYGDAKQPMTQEERAAWDKAHPGSATPLPGALQKDQVEDHLKTEVCAGTITLARAQAIITTDWYVCYLKVAKKTACQ